MWRIVKLGLTALVALVVLGAGTAWAQTASIAGVVRDARGVMPGVTVEAASPALIEKMRTVVTDGEGQYKIINLRAGHLRGDVHAGGLQHRQARRASS